MHTLLLPACLLCAALAGQRAPSQGHRSAAQDPVPQVKADALFRDLGLAAALEAARPEGRVVLVEFSAPWNEESKRLAELTWSDPKVRAWIGAHAVAIRIDGDQHGELARDHRIRGYPTLLLLEPAGGEVHRFTGFVEAGAFLKTSELKLSVFRELVRAREAVDAAPEDPAAHLRLAQALRRHPQRQQEALAAFVQAWRLGRDVESFREESLAALVGDMGTMMRTLPVASTTLEKLREEVGGELLAPAEPPPEDATPEQREEWRARREQRLLRLGEELLALNGALYQPGSTLQAYDVLRAREDTPAAVLALLLDDSVVALLLQQKRYADLVDGLGDVTARVEARLAKMQSRKLEDDPEDVLALTVERNLAVAEAARYYQALLGAGRPDQAGDLRELVLAFESTSHCYLALINAALGAGARDVARELAERGRKTLPELEARRLASLLQRMDLSGS